ncbi:50S ribosomal protein L32 [Isoptericola aurantiacus]|uniref:50S ribosomal protein L32 n=1 Tax=Isoptericola aurantiacus TaxID=3377839 RepID=UPI003839F49A
MAVPKRKTSRSRTRHRRARWKGVEPALVPVVVDGESVQVPPRLARAVREGRIDPR